MSEQHFNNSVDDTVNVAQTVEEKPDGNTSSTGRDLKQPVAGISLDLVIDPKKKGFHITSTVELDGDDLDVEVPGSGYADQVQQGAETAAVIEQNSLLLKNDGISGGVQPKKKISFQVTSIESKEGRRRGDDEEELNESEFLEDEAESPDSTLSHAFGNGNSRFRVVKIPRYDSKMYTRGRWGCWDFVKPPPSAVPYLNEIPGHNLDLSEKTDSDISVPGKNSVVSNATAWTIAKGADSNLELLSHEVTVQQGGNITGETQIYEERNPIIKNDSVSNPCLPKIDERSELPINNSSGLGRTSECLPAQHEEDDTKLRLDISEDELVAKKIEKAMNQVVQIKADLLQNVNADVKKLKQTIQQLTQENQRLKEENESLKQQLSNQTKSI